MMVAWYFATALAKRYDETVVFLEQHRLDPWIHNKAIQKPSKASGSQMNTKHISDR